MNAMTALQTQDSKFEPWRSQAEHATSRSRRLPTIIFLSERGRNILFLGKFNVRAGDEPYRAISDFPSRQLVQRRPNVFDAGPTLYKCY